MFMIHIFVTQIIWMNVQLIDETLVSEELDFNNALTIAGSIFNKYCKTLEEDIILCRREKERFMG